MEMLKWVYGFPPICRSGTHQSHHSSPCADTVTGALRISQDPVFTYADFVLTTHVTNQRDCFSKQRRQASLAASEKRAFCSMSRQEYAAGSVI